MSKLIYGQGVNDLPRGSTWFTNDEGKRVRVPVFKKWKAMLQRSYDPKLHSKYPSYIGTEVCEEWKMFSNFKSWYDQNYTEGFVLDKDLLSGDSKLYSPETCIYIPEEINLFFANKQKNGGKFLLGVIEARSKKNPFGSNIVTDGKMRYLGIFPTEIEAHNAYVSAKHQHVSVLLHRYSGVICDRTRSMLIQIIEMTHEDFKKTYCSR